MPLGHEGRRLSLSAVHGQSVRRADRLRHLRTDDRELAASRAKLSSLVSRQALSSRVSGRLVLMRFAERGFAGRRWRTWASARGRVMRVGVRFHRRRRLRLSRRALAHWVGIGVRTAATISVWNATCSSTTWCIAVRGVANSTGVNCTKNDASDYWATYTRFQKFRDFKFWMREENRESPVGTAHPARESDATCRGSAHLLACEFRRIKRRNGKPRCWRTLEFGAVGQPSRYVDSINIELKPTPRFRLGLTSNIQRSIMLAMITATPRWEL